MVREFVKRYGWFVVIFVVGFAGMATYRLVERFYFEESALHEVLVNGDLQFLHDAHVNAQQQQRAPQPSPPPKP